MALRLVNSAVSSCDTTTYAIVSYTIWQQESLSFINGLGDETIWDKQFDINADWSIDVHGNKYKFGLYHPGGANNSLYDPPATLFMMYSPDGTNTQVLGPVTVSSGEEAESMKARWKEELLKMKRGDTVKSSGGTYDIFMGTGEDGGKVYWGKYVFGGRLYQTGFQSGDEITVGNYIQKLLEQKLLASQRASSYENQYDDIWAGYEYMTALYAQSIPNYPFAQKAPHIVLHNALETLLYNRIVALESQYPSLSSLDARSANLIERSQLYQSISKPHSERLRTLADGVEKDAEVAKARLIGHELTKIAILQCQISAERELGVDRIEAIKAGTETVLSFVPVVSTGVSLALLFDESKSLDEKAWELAGLIPYGKNLKYVGRIDELVETVGGIARKVDINTKVVRILGDKNVILLKKYFESLANNWNQSDITEILENSLEKSPAIKEQVLRQFQNGEIYLVQRAQNGKLVYLDKQKFEHIAELRDRQPLSHVGELIKGEVISDPSQLPGLISNVLKNGVDSTTNSTTIEYTMQVGNKTVKIATDNINGWIRTIYPQ